jgi:hypothetical protein
MTIWGNIATNHFSGIDGNYTRLHITLKEYEDWKKQALFDNLRGLRYGQSFCNTFDITDNLLFFTMNHKDADDYIRANYIANR